jgi:TPR repeat protein
MSDTKNDDAAQLYDSALEHATRPEPDLAEAGALLRRAVARGSPDATYALATWYLFGKEPYVQKDLSEAARLLILAAAAGLPDAMYDLAVCYEKGSGVDKDDYAAYTYYLKAALRTRPKAVFDVGRCLYWGIGTREDRGIATLWLDRAKELGTYESHDQ